MRCVPEQKNKKTVYSLIFALWIGGVILYAVPDVCTASGVTVPTWLFEALAVAAIIAGVFLLIRYGMTHFTYVIRPRSDAEDLSETGRETAFAGAAAADVTMIRPEFLDFIVTKAQGARDGAMECVLGLGDLAAVYPVKKRGSGGMTPKQVREKYSAGDGGFVFYDYTVTFLLDDALELVFADGSRYVGVILEPDAAMTRYLTSLKSGDGGDSDDPGSRFR